MKQRMVFLTLLTVTVGVAAASWAMTVRAGYETAEYQVIESDGEFEIRVYPDLMLAATNTQIDAQGRDGSFMRLFRYISGANSKEQKIAMTTPVLMQREVEGSDGSMSFVMPKEISRNGLPVPNSDGVMIRKRDGGRFAVIQFSGRLTSQITKQRETRLREWMKTRGLDGDANAEAAGYDPPFTPGPLRRNEVLIRLSEQSNLLVDRNRE